MVILYNKWEISLEDLKKIRYVNQTDLYYKFILVKW